MTGNSRLEKSLFSRNRELPAAFRSRYSFSRLFFNFYLLTMGSFIVIMLFADFVMSAAIRNATDDYARRFMQGTVVLVEKELVRYPKSQWSRVIKTLDNNFAYKLELQDRSRLNLPIRQVEKLDRGGIALDAEGDIMYHLISDTSWVLVMGPLSPDHNPKYKSGIPIELRVRLLSWALIGICFAIAVWLWLRPFWRDLEAMRQTARALGEGQLTARAPSAKSRPFQLMADTLNGMADRIQRLIAAQNELTGAISHELRTPIARMRFALEILMETDIHSEEERMWTMMGRDLDELEGLIDASLTYSRFGRGSPEINPVPIEIGPWLAEQTEAIGVLGRNIEMQLKLDDQLTHMRVHLDPRIMPYATKNLLRNATKYAKEYILVSVEIDDQMVRIHVDDDGIGVSPEDYDRVFDAFARLDRSRDRSTGGYGLGLAIARQVVELHGGTIAVDSSPLGGARFTLEWPVNGVESPNNSIVLDKADE